jgi:hypothetical protein
VITFGRVELLSTTLLLALNQRRKNRYLEERNAAFSIIERRSFSSVYKIMKITSTALFGTVISGHPRGHF